MPPFLHGLLKPQASFGDAVVTRVRSNRDFVVKLYFESFPELSPNMDDLDEVGIYRLDGLVVIRAEIASELGFSGVAFLPVKKRLNVSIASKKNDRL